MVPQRGLDRQAPKPKTGTEHLDLEPAMHIYIFPGSFTALNDHPSARHSINSRKCKPRASYCLSKYLTDVLDPGTRGYALGRSSFACRSLELLIRMPRLEVLYVALFGSPDEPLRCMCGPFCSAWSITHRFNRNMVVSAYLWTQG